MHFMNESKVDLSRCEVINQLMQGHDLLKCIFLNVRNGLYYMGISSSYVSQKDSVHEPKVF